MTLPREVHDDIGNYWETCDRDDCDLHVDRPGHVTCHGVTHGCPQVDVTTRIVTYSGDGPWPSAHREADRGQ